MSQYEMICDGCQATMHGSTESIVPAYSVSVTTFSANLYYCSACWRKMLAGLRKKRQPRADQLGGMWTVEERTVYDRIDEVAEASYNQAFGIRPQTEGE